MAAVVFEDDWTGTNGDPWNATKWPTISSDGSTNDTVDIQNNRGHFKIGTVTGEYFSANAAAASSLQDSNGIMQIQPSTVSAANKWLYVCFRSTGEQQTGQSGRPISAYYARFNMSNNDVGSNDFFYGRKGNTEGSSLFTLNNSQSRDAGDSFWFRWEIWDGATDVVNFRYKTWPTIDPEPSPWRDELDFDAAPGVLYGASGITQLVGRNYAGGNNIEEWVDNLEVTDPDASPPAAGDGSTGAFAAMIMQAA